MTTSNLPISPALSMVQETGAFLEDVRNEIEERMEQGSNDASRFVTKDSLLEIWAHGRLERLCRMADPDETEYNITIDRLKTNLLRTLSILVSIHWPDWHRFRKIFFDNRYSTAGERVDRKIKKYTEMQLAKDDFLGSKRLARDFLRIRDAFFPLVIKKGMVKMLQEGRRLPFILQDNGVVELGSGGYGTVTKAVIAVRRYHIDGTPQPDVYPVARKVLRQEDEFKREVGNLASLRSALSKHERVAPFLAIISIGNEFNILSELALMNLEEFLEGRHVKFQVTAERLMSELAALSDALKWLHDGIYIPRDSDLKSEKRKQQGPKFCCHMDLKPENILIYQSRNVGIGIWKISDFGISRIKDTPRAGPKTESTRSAGDLLTVPDMLGDLKKKMTSRSNHTRAQRPAGTWTAPEVQRSAGKVVGRESDIWSFGCIFVLVCALALGQESFNNLQSMRGKTAEGYSYDAARGDCFYERNGHESFVLNPHIVKFINSLPDQPGHSLWFLQNSRNLVLSTLAISPKNRMTASQLHQALDAIFDPPFESGSTPKSLLSLSPKLSLSFSAMQVNQLNSPNTQPHNSQIVEPRDATNSAASDHSGSSDSARPTGSNNRYPDGATSEVIDDSQLFNPEEIISISLPDKRNRSPKGKQKENSQSPILDEDELKDISPELTPIVENGAENGNGCPFAIHQLDQPGPSATKPPRILVTPETNSDHPKNFLPKLNRNPLSSTFNGITRTHYAMLNSENKNNFPSPIGLSERDFAFRSRSTLPTNVSGPHTSPDRTRKSNSPRNTGLKKTKRAQTVPEAYFASRPPLSQEAKSSPPVLNGPTRQSSVIDTPTSLRPAYRANSVLNYQHSIHSSRSNLSGLNSSRFSSTNDTLIPILIPLHNLYSGSTGQTIMAPTGIIVAFLSPECIYVYPLYGETHQRSECPAPTGWRWISVSISGEYLLAKGQLNSNRTTKFKLYQVRSIGDGLIEIEEKGTSPDCLCEDGVVSPDGYVLYQEQNQVRLVNLDLSKNVAPQTLTVDSKIKKSWFNATGSWAFVWFVMNQEHHVAAWKVADTRICHRFVYSIPEHERFGSPVRSILSFPDSRKLLFWKAHNNIMAVPELHSARWLRDSHPLKYLQALTISPTQNCVVYIRSKRKWRGFRGYALHTTLYIRKIDFDSDGNMAFGRHRKGILQHHFQHGSSCIAAVQSMEEHVIHVFVSHCNGHVEKVIFDEREL